MAHNNVQQVQLLAQRITDNVGKVIVGKDDVIKKVLIAMFCSGHVLLEDIPGTGKTTMAKALAKSLESECKRIQFTPDLLPSDLSGVNFYNQKLGEFVFKAGPIFSNIVLADEINRATPRTQSSLLECMEEGQVTIDGVTTALEKPFFVIATQNPIETQGTFPLPEAQLDRFAVRLSMGYPESDQERAILNRFRENTPMAQLESVASKAEVIAAQQAIRTVQISDAVGGYMVDLANATRQDETVRLGVSPRGTLMLMRASQAHAAIEGRDYVIPDDVKAVAAAVLAHRIILKGHNTARTSASNENYIRQLLATVPAPIDDAGELDGAAEAAAVQ